MVPILGRSATHRPPPLICLSRGSSPIGPKVCLATCCFLVLNFFVNLFAIMLVNFIVFPIWNFDVDLDFYVNLSLKFQFWAIKILGAFERAFLIES